MWISFFVRVSGVVQVPIEQFLPPDIQHNPRNHGGCRGFPHSIGTEDSGCVTWFNTVTGDGIQKIYLYKSYEMHLPNGNLTELLNMTIYC